MKWGLLLGFILLCINPLMVSARAETPTDKPSVIIMIGDGMGPNQVEFGRLIEYGTTGNSSILDFPYSNRISTNNIDDVTTDSAASATAIATGVKTKNGRIGMNWDASKEIPTILEIAKNNGYKTGLIATVHVTHATPAAFSAHNEDRDNYQEIGADIAANKVDLILAGGYGVNYMGLQLVGMQNAGYTYIDEKGEMWSATTLPLIGLFSEGGLPKEGVRNDTQIPSLSEMTTHAISLLNATGQPFFMMIEGSQIDSGGHANDPLYIANEVIEFEKAVKVAKNYAIANGNTLLLVTADHETGGFSIKSSANLNAPLPDPTDNITTLRLKREARAHQIETDFSTGGHTSTKVYLQGLGPNATMIAEAQHHIDTYGIMRSVIDGKTAAEGENYNAWYVNPIWYYSVGGAGLLGVMIIIPVQIIKRKKQSQKK